MATQLHPRAQELAEFLLEVHPDLKPLIDKFTEQSDYDPKEDCEEESVGGWTISDMIEACEMFGKTVSEEDAEAIFCRTEKRFDASIGLDWDSIFGYAQELASEGSITLLDYTPPDEET